jgi:hypothetical protein
MNSFSFARPVANRTGQCPVAHIRKVQMHSMISYWHEIKRHQPILWQLEVQSRINNI